MRRINLFGVALCAVALAACGDDAGGAGAAGGSGGSSGAGGSGGSGMMATFSGTVFQDTDSGEVPIEGAMVSVWQTSISTRSDASGNFSLQVPVGGHFFVTSASGNFGFAGYYDVPPSGIAGEELEVIADTDINQVGVALGTPIDTAKGIVVAEFEMASGSGGESATIDSPSEATFTFEQDVSCEQTPVVAAQLQANACPNPDDRDDEVIFANVDPTDNLTVTPSGNGTNDCVLAYDVPHPVIAKTLTFAEVICTPII